MRKTSSGRGGGARWRAGRVAGGGAHWVDTDGNGDYSDETTPLTSTTVDDVWSAGYVGLYRAASTSGALQQYDDVRIGCDNTFHKGDLVKGRAATGTSRTPADGIDANIDRTGERCGRCGVAVWAHGLVPNPVHGIVVPESGEGLVRANSAARSAMLSACRDIYFE